MTTLEKKFVSHRTVYSWVTKYKDIYKQIITEKEAHDFYFDNIFEED
jgi:transposase-like protein